MKLIKVAAAVAGAIVLLSTGVAVGAGALGRSGSGLQGEEGQTGRFGGGYPPPGGSEGKLVPIAPCRMVDTRVAGGRLAAGTVRSFDVDGGAAQGGKAGGCGDISGTSNAVAVSITAVSASGNGYLRVWPDDQTEPAATFLNYTSTFNASTAGIVGTGASGHVAVKAFAAGTHVVIDVFGYYATPMSATIAPDGSLWSGTRVASSSKQGTGWYQVAFDRDVEGCSVSATVGGVDGYAAAYSNPLALPADVVEVKTWTLDDGGTPASPLAADAFVHVVVTC